ncbi:MULTISPECIES: excinuclease ABC subunit UvrC [unclassified Campylobacter]|uniref:excinuclease ABC subunit UvrC n=1 Tax=unclassified Campylobacter TaxID=2593542 RepID=UPI0022E9B9A3|nr:MULTISPECIES: excinuclease ABC subunit UvrC [unclassified Campylobacter]MDA3079662.1 excinuclease ABC subunit UvrC [Campylobacter sp. CS_NA2]MDA3080906.1 excinuclease ABC subunit UvrC [Campylobacter sp. CS_NA1]MDA3085457.1 excinuclease ABC subunit UvrC [Campylobacter sp. CS_ED1]MDA3090494.1 excinuclease ABC subunit UvrC [Campylobacter sp. CS_ED2]WBR50724.1 excinuclease ABC subunit UvrC [Campylobacter sp. CS_NA3]
MLIDEIKTLPNLPGVYEYFDKNGKLLYVGKAKNLKNRVKSYFSFTPKLSPNSKNSARICKMISEAAHLEYIVTPSESDALILENSFIKQLRPKYNILLRDDKTYPYIFVNLNDEFPRFEITRKLVKGSNIKYFGPYFRGGREILEILYMKFALVQKKSCIKAKKACLFHQIGRCKAPCENKISKDEYAKIVQNALNALKNPQSMIPDLSNLMMKYAENENYEEAAGIRDKIEILKDIEIKTQVDLAKLDDFEVIAVNSHSDLICAVHFSVRGGKIASSNSNIINCKNADFSDIKSVYTQVILDSFPQNSPIASSKIYLYDEFDDNKLVSEILSKRHGRNFKIISPKIGEKRRICEIAYQNCEININKHLKTHNFEFQNELKEYFDLENLPINIEIFDNSHMFGTAPVGAMVAWSGDKFDKSKYRHAHLSSNNDYDQMLEFLSERAKRFDKLSPPDLWVIDGGTALLNLASEIISSSGANIDIIAISKEKIDAKAHRAKGSAKDKICTKNGVFSLSTDDKKLQFFQKLRDEAHRFAISFHQKTKKKQDLQSSKLVNLGISQGKIKKLLDFYGSFESIYLASFDEIKSLTDTKTAEKLFKNR